VELNDRLLVPKGRFAGQLLIPSRLHELTMEMQQGILDEYESLMPNPQRFFTEIRRWRAKWGIESDAAKPNDLQSTLQVTNRQHITCVWFLSRCPLQQHQPKGHFQQ
jgi:hypothetical protein